MSTRRSRSPAHAGGHTVSHAHLPRPGGGSEGGVRLFSGSGGLGSRKQTPLPAGHRPPPRTRHTTRPLLHGRLAVIPEVTGVVSGTGEASGELLVKESPGEGLGARELKGEAAADPEITANTDPMPVSGRTAERWGTPALSWDPRLPPGVLFALALKD